MLANGRVVGGVVVVLAGLVLPVPAAAAGERVLTLYSPRIDSLPYCTSSTRFLRPDGKEAPAEPGYILGFKEQVLVDWEGPRRQAPPDRGR